MARWVVLVPHRKFAPYTFKTYKPIAKWEEPLHKFTQPWVTLSPTIPQPPQSIPLKRVYKTPPAVIESARELHEAAKALREPPPKPEPRPVQSERIRKPHVRHIKTLDPDEVLPLYPSRKSYRRAVVRAALHSQSRFEEQRVNAAHESFLQFLDRNFPTEYELELLHGRSDP